MLIKNDDLRKLSFALPGFLTALFLVFYYLNPNINIFDNGGLVQSIGGFLERLTGFYIASLAAIATFNSPYLDKGFRGKPAYLEHYDKGEVQKESLTRRRFLCFLFGYCSFSSIIIFLTGMFAVLSESSVKMAISADLHQLAVASFITIYMFFFFNLIVTTLLGLAYLTDRIVSEN